MNMTLLMQSSFRSGSSFPKIHILLEQVGLLVMTLWEQMLQFATLLLAQTLSFAIFGLMESVQEESLPIEQLSLELNVSVQMGMRELGEGTAEKGAEMESYLEEISVHQLKYGTMDAMMAILTTEMDVVATAG